MSRYQLLPDLPPDQLDELRADIAERGVMVPVEYDEEGNLLDGHHRRLVADELGIDCPSVVRPFDGDEEEKLAHVVALNLARRHLDPEQRRQVVAKLRERGMSTRRIAETTGIPRSTVSDDLAGVRDRTPEQSGQTVTGADGKEYPATRPPDPGPDPAAEYREAVDEFPFLGPGESPGVPEDEVVKIAHGLRAVPEGPERDVRMEAARRWHRRYQDNGGESDERLDAYRAACRMVEMREAS